MTTEKAREMAEELFHRAMIDKPFVPLMAEAIILADHAAEIRALKKIARLIVQGKAQRYIKSRLVALVHTMQQARTLIEEEV
jgi:hypothetical protein